MLGNYSIMQLPDMTLTGLNDLLDNESLIILAGLSDKNNSFEIEQYSNKALLELEIRKPIELESAKIMLIYYLKFTINIVDIAFDKMLKINKGIYKQLDWKRKFNFTNKIFIGEELEMKFMYIWYRELHDFKYGSKLFYDSEYPRTEQNRRRNW